MPSIPPPGGAGVRRPIDVTLKAGWRYDPRRQVFASASGDQHSIRGALPKGSRVVYKVPGLADADEARLSTHEKALRRHLQVILPEGLKPGDHLETVRAWPPVASAELGPDVSLPGRDNG